jgi:hypothetical protein
MMALAGIKIGAGHFDNVDARFSDSGLGCLLTKVK